MNFWFDLFNLFNTNSVSWFLISYFVLVVPSNKCCVLGCKSDKMVKKHVFPSHDDEFVIWISRTGNKKFENLPKTYVRKTYLFVSIILVCLTTVLVLLIWRKALYLVYFYQTHYQVFIFPFEIVANICAEMFSHVEESIFVLVI